jgi:hypothetical protein
MCLGAGQGVAKHQSAGFDGFKPHLVINDQGERINFQATTGNIDDREPVPSFAKPLFGKRFGDKGYLSPLCGMIRGKWEQARWLTEGEVAGESE